MKTYRENMKPEDIVFRDYSCLLFKSQYQNGRV